MLELGTIGWKLMSRYANQKEEEFIMNKNKYVLITGATKGIGNELTRIFARHLYSLILVSRNEEQLKKIAEEFQQKFSIDVLYFALDLSNPLNAHKLADLIEEKNIPVHILINNAGFGAYGNYLDIDLRTEEEMIQLNILSLSILTKRFAKIMKERDGGKILNVASTAAFQPGPYMSVYYATKAYVLSFSEALYEELKPLGIQVSTLCPGPTKTDFHTRAGTTESRLMNMFQMSAEECAVAAFQGLMQGKRLIIPGWINKIGVFSIRLAPRGMILKFVKFIMSKRQSD